MQRWRGPDVLRAELQVVGEAPYDFKLGLWCAETTEAAWADVMVELEIRMQLQSCIGGVHDNDPLPIAKRCGKGVWWALGIGGEDRASLFRSRKWRKQVELRAGSRVLRRLRRFHKRQLAA